jgi:hypothetical protein
VSNALGAVTSRVAQLTVPVSAVINGLVVNQPHSQPLLFLVWPAEMAGYQLEASEGLGVNAWSTNVPSLTVTNGQNQVLIPMTDLQRFFRLRKQ